MRIKASILALALIGAPFGLQAVGLGKINVFSSLGQPLRAEVQLSAAPEELPGVQARLASPDAFRQAGIEFSPSLRGVTMSVERRPEGAVLRLSSDRPINEPFVDLLIELNWPAGRLLREYTFLLDPAEAASASAAVAVAPAPESRASAAPQPAPRAVEAPKPRVQVERPAPVSQEKTASRPSAEPRQEGVYLVKPGDTLRNIAQRHQPEGASLEQMLAALYRSNRSAFLAGNINRLMAGKILTLPDDEAVKAIPPGEARRLVVASSNDFAAYRRRLAADVQAQPARETAASRQSGGKIAPQVEEKGPVANLPKDQLKVSRTGEVPDAKAAAGQTASLERLRALEEDQVAKDKALKEANARLAELEKNISQLQSLIEMKNRALANAQQAGAPAPAPEAPKAEAAKPAEPEKPAEARGAEVAKPPQQAASLPVRPPAAPEEDEEEAPKEGLFSNPAVLAGGGGILALLLGWAGLAARRRRQAKEVVPPPQVQPQLASGEGVQAVQEGNGGQTVDTSPTPPPIQTDFSQAGLGSIDTSEGVDPVAEADVYIAYGRDAQAEEILLDALKTDHSRPAVLLKLLEIYAQRGAVEPFDKYAAELEALTGGQGPEWEMAQALGRRLSPDNPRYRQPGSFANAVAAASSAYAAAVPADLKDDSGNEGIDFRLTGVALPDVKGEHYDQLDDESEAEAPVVAAAQEVAVPVLDEEHHERAASQGDLSAIDFDLDLMSEPETAVDESASATGTTSTGLDFELDFPVPDSGTQAEEMSLEDTVVAPELNALGTSASGADGAWKAPAGLDFDLGLGGDGLLAEAARKASADVDIDLAATQIGNEPFDQLAEEAPAADHDEDMEKTRIESNFLDFDFNPGSEPTPAPAQMPVDLSDIDLNLDLDLPPEEHGAPEIHALDDGNVAPVEPDLHPDLNPFAEFAPKDGGEAGEEVVPAAEAAPAEPEIDPLVLQEVATKLELARAYEEMGDREGAKELLDEAIRDGSPAQQDEARVILGRL